MERWTMTPSEWISKARSEREKACLRYPPTLREALVSPDQEEINQVECYVVEVVHYDEALG
jgi:hypothetical protein